MLKGTGLSKKFGGLVALSGVDFEVKSKEIVGLIGPNGSGKTTLFNVISGLLKPDAGQVTFKDKKLTGLPPNRIAAMGIGRTFQIVRPLMDLNLLENVATAVLFGSQAVSGLSHARGKAAQILSFAGLGGKIYRFPGQLALEDLKRLEVARALGSGPRVLLLDEVFAGLNPKEIHGAIDLTFRIRDEYGIGVFMIEHVMKAIMSACSRVIALHYGVKIADGDPKAVANEPEVVRAYLGAGYAGR